MPLYAQDHRIAMPIPAHAQTDGAREAVEVMISLGVQRRIERELSSMVTNHGRPPVEPYVKILMREEEYEDAYLTKKGKLKVVTRTRLVPTGEVEVLDPVTAAAKRLLADADARGWRTNLITLTDRCAVEAVRGTVAFRAVWVRGKAAGARWFERDYRYEYIDDPRPEPKVSAVSRLSLAKRRPVGVSKHHLKVVASPQGVPIAMTTLARRIKES